MASDLLVPRLPGFLLVNTAVPVRYVERQTVPAEWIEGEPGSSSPEPVEGVAFACKLFMPGPGGQQDNAYRPRVVQVPTLLFNPVRDDDSPIVIGREDDLLVTAPEVAPWTGGETVRWTVDGDVQPFGPPGLTYGLMALLRRIED